MTDPRPRPVLAITMGDPAGIGPEIVLKALAHESVAKRCLPLVIGDRRILERAMGWDGIPTVKFRSVTNPGGVRSREYRTQARLPLWTWRMQTRRTA